MKRILRFLPVLVVVFFTAIAVSCGSDEKEEVFDTPIVPGVVGGNGSGNEENGTNPAVKGLRLASIETDYSDIRFWYDADGNLVKFTGEYSGNVYNVTYNPFEINYEDDNDKVRVYNVKFTKEGYIKSFTLEEESTEYDEYENYVETDELIYNDGFLVKMVGDFSEIYESISSKGKGTMTLKWVNGNVTAVEVESVGGDGKSASSVGTGTTVFEYNGIQNNYKQFTKPMALAGGDCVSPLMYLGFFGKACEMLPSVVTMSSVYDEKYGGLTYKTLIEEKHRYEYEFNKDKTLNVVHDEYENIDKEWENGSLIYDSSDYGYTYNNNYYYHYTEAEADATSNRCVKYDVKKNYRKGLFGLNRIR